MASPRDRSSEDLTNRRERALIPQMELPPFQSLLASFLNDRTLLELASSPSGNLLLPARSEARMQEFVTLRPL